MLLCHPLCSILGIKEVQIRMVSSKSGRSLSKKQVGSDIVLECRNISKNFGHIQALRDVSFELRKGEILGLVGDNGAGKSTLIKIIRGVFKPTSGEIYIEGEKKEFNNPRDSIREGIQCVYQESALVEQLSVAENFFIGQEPIKRYTKGWVRFVDFKKMREEANKCLVEVGFHLDVMEEITNFSGGERQAVAVTRALYSKPKILLLDEPTTALSEKAQIRLFTLFREIKEICPLIFVTHDLDDVIQLCDRMIILKLGELAFESEIKEGFSKEKIFQHM
ncbi:MAG: ATP-binding cassette domain-containing protein [Clostridia bacterium]|nr:ATP-binding cassette domain-containing protein [Clostridia bacterium]